MRVDRRTLYQALKKLLPLMSKQPDDDAAHVTLRSAGGAKLAISASTEDVQLTCLLPADGYFVGRLPGRWLAKLVKPSSRGREDVGLEVHDEHTAKVEVGGVVVKAALHSAGSANPVPGGDGDWSNPTKLPAAAMNDLLSFVLPAMSKDVGRPHLCTLLLDRQCAVTTDGHRLMAARLPGVLPQPLLVEAFVAKMLSSIISDGDELVLQSTDTHLRAMVGPWTLIARVRPNDFPPFRQVIPDPESLTARVEVDARALAGALDTLRPLTDGVVQLRVNGAITLSTWCSTLGEAEVEIPTIESNHAGDDLVVGLDPAYLEAALAKTRQPVVLSVGGPLDPVRIDHPDGRLAVVMPRRLV
ncbi:MAG: hypothetical protein KC503_34010 [Myxococcales bacterium]|nr:hypothetical protein [Myxococcales bacterium]